MKQPEQKQSGRVRRLVHDTGREIGSTVADMHCGRIPTEDFDHRPITVTNVTRVDVSNADVIVRAFLPDGPPVGNKFAVVVGYWDCEWVAVWSYDGNMFGIMRFTDDEEETK